LWRLFNLANPDFIRGFATETPEGRRNTFEIVFDRINNPMSVDAIPAISVNPVNPVNPANPTPVRTILTADGELYVQGDTIIGRKVISTHGGSKYTKYYRGDKLHREDGPAFIREDKDGSAAEEYCRDGKGHRDGDLPSRIYRSATGIVIYEEYKLEGKFHRDGDAPAFVSYDDNGVVTDECYYCDNKLHRDGDAPASIIRNKAGKILSQAYYRGGKMHRDGGQPAYITYYCNADDSVAKQMKYYINGKPGRPGGLPTSIRWGRDGKVISVKYVSEHAKIKLTGEKAAAYEHKAFECEHSAFECEHSAAELAALKQRIREILN